ncbi:hypothetical protein OSTOST_02320, partial [Ostertagia ostertagi]
SWHVRENVRSHDDGLEGTLCSSTGNARPFSTTGVKRLHATRCPSDSYANEVQQLSKNFIWGKLEQLLEFFGFGNGTQPKKANGTSIVEDDYVDEPGANNWFGDVQYSEMDFSSALQKVDRQEQHGNRS